MAGWCVSSTGVVNDNFIANELGFGSGWRAEFESLGANAMVGSGSGRSYVGQGVVTWDKFSTWNFCDVLGYPVPVYSDLDTVIRQQLLFKGSKGDPADLPCALFFVNQLDFGDQ